MSPTTKRLVDLADAQPTVLVVEDEEAFVEALTVGLKREGFRVHVARDGAEALMVFGAIDPDLVLLDVMLPKLSGVDVCREIDGPRQAIDRSDGTRIEVLRAQDLAADFVQVPVDLLDQRLQPLERPIDLARLRQEMLVAEVAERLGVSVFRPPALAGLGHADADPRDLFVAMPFGEARDRRIDRRTVDR